MFGYFVFEVLLVYVFKKYVVREVVEFDVGAGDVRFRWLLGYCAQALSGCDRNRRVHLNGFCQLIQLLLYQ